jgi:hypothetical protein
MWKPHGKILGLAGGFAVVVGALLFGSRFVPGLGILSLPFSWPGLLILGADETQERYGYWGELILFWLCSLPCIIGCSWLICQAWQRRSDAEVNA